MHGGHVFFFKENSIEVASRLASAALQNVGHDITTRDGTPKLEVTPAKGHWAEDPTAAGR